MTNLDRLHDIERLRAWYCDGRDCGMCQYNKSVECGLVEWLNEEADK